MALPPVNLSVSQGIDSYDAPDQTSLVTPFVAERANGDVFTPVPTGVTQDSTTGVITVTATITVQSYLAGGLTQVFLQQNTPNAFIAPVSVATLVQALGFNIIEIEKKYAEGTKGDFTLTIEGDNEFVTKVITNPFD